MCLYVTHLSLIAEYESSQNPLVCTVLGISEINVLLHASHVCSSVLDAQNMQKRLPLEEARREQKDELNVKREAQLAPVFTSNTEDSFVLTSAISKFFVAALYRIIICIFYVIVLRAASAVSRAHGSFMGCSANEK